MGCRCVGVKITKTYIHQFQAVNIINTIFLHPYSRTPIYHQILILLKIEKSVTIYTLLLM